VNQTPKAAKTSRSSKPKVSMMDQFWAAKKEQPDALLFFRMGDFYELFGEDAKVAARELGIALTSRAKGTPNALPMAGFPVKSLDGYLMKLVAKGFRVAICEQMSDPRTTKGIVDRDIVRVVTAGTLTEEDALDARASNWLASLAVDGKRVGLAWVDVSTGRFQVSEFGPGDLDDYLARLDPAELLWADGLSEAHPDLALLAERMGSRLSLRDGWRFEREACRRALHEHFKVRTLEGFGVEDDSPIVPAAGALIEYLQETQRGACDHILVMRCEDPGGHMVLDRATRATLELVQTQRGGRGEGSLLSVIDRSLTSMGGRLLREWLLAPLRDVQAIRYRQLGVAELVDGPFLREEVRGHLEQVLDIERLSAKVSTGRANGRDLVALADSLAVVRPLYDTLENVYSKLLGDLREALDPLDELVARVLTTLVDSPPTTLKEGGLVREGVDPELDELRQIAGDGKAWMARFQADEAERTGLPGLKVGYNSVFGYYIEIPRAQAVNAPDSYIRKQTLKNAERFITPQLKEFEDKVLSSEELSRDMEYDMFLELRQAVAGEIPRILGSAAALATLDVLAALAQLAAEQRYVAPTVDGGERIHVVDGRHPVIEVTQNEDTFVPNDTNLDRKSRMIGLITGPNMAGKSTYIRQTALVVLLAQIGSYVPASEASLGVVDRIFTRIGSADDLSRGASTFMVEMVEIAGILNNATAKSLIVLDEVGRGTSTFDGLALAWAIVEHVHEVLRARTLFATHYHQLTELAERLEGVHNLNVAVREWQDEIVFLHKIVEGGTDRSYGIQVARLAGVPQVLVDRAKQILRDIERDEDLAPRVSPPKSDDKPDGPLQLGLFHERELTPVEKRLTQLDPDETTPVDALLALHELRDLLDRS
jgi:DNA mismatch repair protein MutS